MTTRGVFLTRARGSIRLLAQLLVPYTNTLHNLAI